MRINRIRLLNFRSYSQVEVIFDKRINVFIGENGVGKTNLLDSIYYGSIGRSYFTGLDKNVLTDGSEFMRMELGLIESQDGVDETRSLVIKQRRGVPKEFIWNDVPVEKLSDHIGKIQVVMMAPQDSFQLLLSNAEKRRWIDSSLSQQSAEYRTALKHYTRLLNQRNEYLKNTPFSQINDQLLLTYWQQMGTHARVVSIKRKTWLDHLDIHLREFYNDISDGSELINMSYNTYYDDQWDDRGRNNLQKDILGKRTSEGVHKDVVNFIIDGGDLKYRGSQGQIKSFVLSLKLAEYKESCKTTIPILLIDDVFAKLDQSRTQRLFSLLKSEIKGQVFMTDTDESKIAQLIKKLEIPFAIFKIEGGQVKQR